jgi:hypothetical protein
MSIKIARKEPVEAVDDYPEGVLFVSPIEDVQLLGLQVMDLLMYKLRRRVQRSASADRHSRPMSVRQQIRSFMQSYLNRRKKVLDLYSRYFFQDAVVSILWWLRYASWVFGAAKQLGK